MTEERSKRKDPKERIQKKGSKRKDPKGGIQKEGSKERKET
ncbi:MULTISPECIES: hypothetical protein [unclassified Methanosarcina]|nr:MULTISPECIES: hypothetical protein [unclassified Methanosarcina]